MKTLIFLEVLPAKELEPFMLSYLEELITNAECRIDMGMNYHNGDPYGTND